MACLASIPVHALSQQVTSGAIVQTYSFADAAPEAPDQVQLVTAPLNAVWARNQVAIAVNGAWARGIATGRTGGFSEIEGLIDVHVTGAFMFGPFTATAIANLPVGQTAYADDDFLILGLVSSDLLSFEVRDWGAGGGMGGSLAYSSRLGSAQLRLTGGYLVTQEYQLLESAVGSFAPGGRARFSLEALIPSGVASLIEVRAVHQRAADDDYSSVHFFSSGSRSELFVSWAHPFGARESILVHTSATRRSAGFALGQLITRQSEADPRLLGAAQIFPGVSNSPGRDLLVAGAALHVDRGRFAALPAAQYRMLRVPNGIEKGWLASIGLGIDYRVAGGKQGRRWIVAPDVRLEKGSYTAPDATHPVTGWRGGVTVRWEGR